MTASMTQRLSAMKWMLWEVIRGKMTLRQVRFWFWHIIKGQVRTGKDVVTKPCLPSSKDALFFGKGYAAHDVRSLPPIQSVATCWRVSSSPRSTCNVAPGMVPVSMYPMTVGILNRRMNTLRVVAIATAANNMDIRSGICGRSKLR